MAGLINGRSVSQCFTSSMEPANSTNTSSEVIQQMNAKHRGEISDPVTEMIGNSSSTLVKSVDEGVFSQLKAQAQHSQGTTHNTIEHAPQSQLNPFSSASLGTGNQNHQRSSTITSNHNRRSQGNNRTNYVA